MSKKMTAVEWLIDYIKNLEKYPYKTIQELEIQAKEMEKQQIIDAHTKGYIIGGGNGDLYDCKQYFNENFNK